MQEVLGVAGILEDNIMTEKESKMNEKKFECQECTCMAPEWAMVGKSEICFLCIPLTDKEIDKAIVFADRKE